MTSRATELKWVLAVLAVLATAFIAFPQLDIIASRVFFRDGSWLVARDSIWLAVPYRGLPRLGQLTILVLATAWSMSFLPRLTRLRPKREVLGFLLCTALAGPVLFVDVGLKDHSGRARPINIEAFGGTKVFSPAFVPANQCQKNCSFVSGHVATASFLMAFGWLAAPATRRRWLFAGMASASLIGLARMLPGGHFLSDVLFAWFAVYFSLWATEWLFLQLGWLQPKAPSCAIASSELE